MTADAGGLSLDEIGAAIVAEVERELPGWVTARVAFVADAWDRLDPTTRADLDHQAASAGAAGAERIAGALRTLFSTPVAQQRTTPLAVVRGAVPVVTVLLRAVGIPPVERDAFDEEAFPDDDYGVTPATLAELGGDRLGPLQLAWGLAKAKAMRNAKGG